MTEQATDPVHGHGWNTADRWGGWSWREPHGAEHFRRCSFCGSIHPEDLATEQAGDGTCRVCGQHGWEACFRTQPLGLSQQETERLLADPSIPEDEKGLLRADYPRHEYDPGGWYASWADRKYGWPHKFYAKGIPNRHPETLRIITVLSAGQEDRMERETGYQWHAIADIPPGTDVSGWTLEDGHYTHVGLGSDKTHFVKFYTLHLADPAISAEAKDAIERASGLRFHFEDGQVSWTGGPP